MTDRLDEEQLETLRAWGEGLAADSRGELEAAGRAILMLAEEIEFLNVDLWHVRQLSALETEGGTAGLAERPVQPG